MAIHFKDTERIANPNKPADKKFRLFGINTEDKPYFYWSFTPRKYGACYGKTKQWRVWGTLTCGSGKANIKLENRVFIADHETALKLESALAFRPCKNCDKTGEYERWAQIDKK